MPNTSYLNGQLLIAMPALADPNFAQTVTYICEHNDQGALGLTINRLSDLKLGDIFDQLSLDPGNAELRELDIYNGGPVQQDRGFVLHEGSGKWDSTMMVSSEVGMTTSRDILAAMADNEGPGRYLIALGYAGWAAGQLEQELAANAWLSVAADPRILFDMPWEERYEASARLLGVDLRLLSTETGHA